MDKAIAIDCDGVLADCVNPFAKLLRRQGAEMRAIPLAGPDCWDWPGAYGATPAQEEAACEYIHAWPAWWESLPVHRDMLSAEAISALREVCHRHEVTVVTARPRGAQRATRRWLRDRFGVDVSVLCCPNKPRVLAELDMLTIDDHLDNVLRLAPEHQLLVRRPYTPDCLYGATVVHSTEEALRRCL